LCWHPEERVPPHTSSKSRQEEGRASTRCHVSYSFRLYLPAEVGSEAATCPTALELPRIPLLRISPPCLGELRCYHVSCGPGPHLLTELSSGDVTYSSTLDLASLPRHRLCHVSHGFGLCLPDRRAPTLPCVPQLWTLPPYRGGLWHCHVAPASPLREERSGGVTYPTTPSGLWTTGIKKGLAAPGTQLGSHVFKAWSCVTEVSARRADRSLQFSSTVQRRPS
jgi:hypothetical protein